MIFLTYKLSIQELKMTTFNLDLYCHLFYHVPNPLSETVRQAYTSSGDPTPDQPPPAEDMTTDPRVDQKA